MVEDHDLAAVLGELAKAGDQVARARARQDVMVARARAAGASWATIAAVLGVTVQAAHKRYRDLRADDATDLAWHEPSLPIRPRRRA